VPAVVSLVHIQRHSGRRSAWARSRRARILKMTTAGCASANDDPKDAKKTGIHSMFAAVERYLANETKDGLAHLEEEHDQHGQVDETENEENGIRNPSTRILSDGHLKILNVALA
jgi:hypothetical protein